MNKIYPTGFSLILLPFYPVALPVCSVTSEYFFHSLFTGNNLSFDPDDNTTASGHNSKKSLTIPVRQTVIIDSMSFGVGCQLLELLFLQYIRRYKFKIIEDIKNA